MDERTLTRKATDALRTCYAIAEDPKPTEVKLKAGTLLRNGGLLLELNTDEAALWLKSDEIINRFLENLGSGACIKNLSGPLCHLVRSLQTERYSAEDTLYQNLTPWWKQYPSTRAYTRTGL